ncbi:hypothetical protein [Aquipseudomonas campi]
MPRKPNATLVGEALRARLEEISQRTGYLTNIAHVYGPLDKVPDKADMPYVLIRVAGDVRTSTAAFQATRLRTFELEAVFRKTAGPADLDGIHVDLLRALGFGQDRPERKFPGLIDDEDEATPRYASAGETTHSNTLTIGVTYVESYN